MPFNAEDIDIESQCHPHASVIPWDIVVLQRFRVATIHMHWADLLWTKSTEHQSIRDFFTEYTYYARAHYPLNLISDWFAYNAICWKNVSRSRPSTDCNREKPKTFPSCYFNCVNWDNLCLKDARLTSTDHFCEPALAHSKKAGNIRLCITHCSRVASMLLNELK